MEYLPSNGASNTNHVLIRARGTPKSAYIDRIRKILLGVIGDDKKEVVLHMTGAAIVVGLEITEDLLREFPKLKVLKLERGEVSATTTELDEETFEELKTDRKINLLKIYLSLPYKL